MDNNLACPLLLSSTPLRFEDVPMCSRRDPLSALAVLALAVAGCAGEPANSGAAERVTPPRALVGAEGKPLRATPTGEAVADERLVRFHPGVSPAEALALVTEAGGEIAWSGRATGLEVVRFADPAAAAAGAEHLGASPLVDEVLDNRITRATGSSHGNGISTSPGPEPAALQWNLRAMGLSPDGDWPAGAGVRVAILDTGVAYEDHVDATGVYALAPSLDGVTFAAGYDFINDDDHPNDDQGHGTHIAGVIAAQRGIVSLAPAIEIMPVKVLDAENTGTELALAEGIVYAVDHGADIINMSLSFPPSYFPSRYLQHAIDYAASHGVVMVAASGNHGGDMVTYPAAFREVIAVGASKISGGGFWSWLGDPWALAELRQQPTDYGNGGWLLDVVAPGGEIDEDVNNDGFPEAILAETFQGDPTDFGYYFYAGTSQAAAEVTGVAASMLAENPALAPDQVRAVMGESASLKGWFLSEDVGRGYLVAGDAIAAAAEPADPDRPRYFAALSLTMHAAGGNQRRGRVVVEVLDAAGVPQPHVVVYGAFTGGVYEAVAGITDPAGQVTFQSPKLDAEVALLAFEVDAVGGIGPGTAFDRPRGTVHIDSCSLELLAAYASGEGISASPDAEGQGVSTSPGPVGQGVSTSSGPEGQGISTSPGPIALRPPLTSSDQISTYTLLNFSWGLSTVPMVVAVDADWFDATFDEDDWTRVGTGGSGISTSPVVIDPDTAFPQPVTLEAYAGGAPDECVALVVRTHLGGPDGDAPIIPDPDAECAAAASCPAWTDLFDEMWGYYAGQGISTSPSPEPDIGLTLEAFEHLALMMQVYVGFSFVDESSPIGSYGAVLDAAGVGLAPLPSQSGVGAGVTSMP